MDVCVNLFVPCALWERRNSKMSLCWWCHSKGLSGTRKPGAAGEVGRGFPLVPKILIYGFWGRSWSPETIFGAGRKVLGLFPTWIN